MAKKKDDAVVLTPQDKQSLAQLMSIRRQLSAQFFAEGGEFEDGMLKVWEDVSIKLPVKVDGYGYILDRFAKEKKMLSEEIDQLKQAMKWIDGQTENMKKRLSFFANGQKLEGLVYSFTPDTSEKREVDIMKVPKETGKYSLPDVTFSELDLLLTALERMEFMYRGSKDEPGKILYGAFAALRGKIGVGAEHKCGVKEAPEEALKKTTKETVRVGRKGSRVDIDSVEEAEVIPVVEESDGE